MAFEMTSTFRDDLPAPAPAWNESPDFSFVGGNNDPDSVPFAGLAEAAAGALSREGRKLATYNLGGSPLGYQPLREFVAANLTTRTDMSVQPDQVLITSGSLQALDLVNEAMLNAGDTVIVEQATYGGMLSRLHHLGVNWRGVQLDEGGIDVQHLDELLGELAESGNPAKYVYTIPTVQNPTGTVMPTERRMELLDVVRRHDVAVFEDDCYAELTWSEQRPSSIRALDGDGEQVIYCGSFSKSIAPAMRVGYLVADEAVLAQLKALKTDAGTGAIEQLTLAEYAPSHFDGHVDTLAQALEAKCDRMMSAVEREFGEEVSVRKPDGGIFVWLEFSDGVNTSAFAGAAAAEGIEFNPGAGWSADPAWGRRHLRLCFGNASDATIDEGVRKLAVVYQTYKEAS